MYIKANDVRFLIDLLYTLKNDVKYAYETETLRALLLSLNEQRIKQNEYARKRIAEKSKIDKNYARKKAK